MMPPDWEFFLQSALKIVGAGICVIALHNVLKFLMVQTHF